MTAEIILASKYQKILTNQSARYTIETSKRERKSRRMKCPASAAHGSGRKNLYGKEENPMGL
jgi:hypothetical protein